MWLNMHYDFARTHGFSDALLNGICNEVSFFNVERGRHRDGQFSEHFTRTAA
jgi:hypothetical protein